jgi:PKD repeat protein
MKDYGYQGDPGSNRLLFSLMGDTGLVGTGKSITVRWGPYPGDAAPVADAGGPYTAAVGVTRRLDGSGSHDPDQFTEPLIYQWDLDDDGVFGEVYPTAARGDETAQRPFFSSDGLAVGTAFPVALRVVDRRGKVSFVSHGVVNVVVNRPPTARIGGPYEVAGGGAVVLDASATTDPDEDTDFLRYEWDFDGDGSFGNGSEHGGEWGQFNTFFAYGLTSPSTYRVYLRVTDAAGHESFDQAYITILPNQPPHAVIGGPLYVSAGSSIVLNALGSTDPEDQYSLSYEWDFNNNEIYGEGFTPQGYEFGDFATFYAADLDAGLWPVRLKVTDPAGNSDTTSVYLTILPNSPPTADAGGPYTVPEGRDIVLDASGSTDPDGGYLQYLWDLDQDGEFDTFGTAHPVFSAATLAGGTQATVRLRVVDSTGVATDTTATVNVTDAAPVLQHMNFTRRLDEGGSGAVMGSVFDTTADEHTATIDWGDGTVESWPAPAGNFLFEHRYGDDGHYTVQFTVSDADGSDSVVTSDRDLNVLWVGFNAMGGGQFMNVTQIHPSQLADWSFGGYDVIYVDSSNFLFNYAPSRAQDFADFVSAGGGLVVEGGGSRDEPDYSWVPKHEQLAWEVDGNNNAAVITPAGQNHRVTSNLANANLMFPFGFRTVHFTATGDLEVLTTTPSGSPNTIAGAFGRGRVVYTGVMASGQLSQSHRDLAHQAAWWAGGNDGPEAVFTVDVDNVAPVISATGSDSAEEGSDYTLNLTSSDPGDDTIAHWTIDWGDGNVQTVPGHPSSVTHAYGENGSYAIRATAADEDGTWSTFTAPGWDVADGGNGHYYLLTSGPLEWNQAEAQAVAMGGHLVSITSQEEQNFVVKNFLLMGREFNIYWLGLTDSGEEGNFRWTSGEDVAYTNWIPFEPDDAGGNEDYAAMNWTSAHNYGGFSMWSDVGALGSPAYGDYNGFVGIVELDAPLPSQRVTVYNAAPAISSVSSPASVIGGAAAGVAVTLSAPFSDPGFLDTHSASIDWGDGHATDAMLSESLGAGAVAGSHAYASGGLYTATVTLIDDDGTATTNSITVYVSGSGVHQGVVQVVGTAAADKFKIERLADGAYLVTDEARGTATRLVAEPGVPVSGVMVLLGGGDDKVNVTGSVTVPALVDGGAGKDTLNGSNACNILIGGAGDDTLTGGNGRDLLVGGLGADRLLGNGGDDILVGGYTAYDADFASLQRVMAEWTRNIPYATRVSDLKNGTGVNEQVVFDGSTVFDDRASDVLTSDAVDTLTGGAGDDWFLSNFAGAGKLDNVTDLKAGEVKTDIA